MHKILILKENEKVVLPIVWLGKETDLSYTVSLSGKGAEVSMLVLLLGRDSQSVVVKTNVYHLKPDTKSKVVIRGVLTDRASADFSGLVKIEPGAKGANAWLAAHLLLLSKHSAGRAVPSLEISENDIKAGHATTVGRVNDLELFYLMSRGLSKKIATNLIVQGFLQSMLDEFPQNLAKKARKEVQYI
jgi:Fe-S cluster assembly protein SufD